MPTFDLSLKLDNDGTEVPFPAVTDATSEAGVSVPVTANLRVAGVDVDGAHPMPITGSFADENGVPFSASNPLPVDVGGNIQIDNLSVSFDSAISALNQPPATLTAGQTWVGTWEDVSDYAAVSVVYLVDAMSAVNGAVAQFSEDGVSPIYSEAATVPAGIPGWSVFAPRARYFRISYTNGASPANVRAQITYHFNPPAVARAALGAPVTDLTVAQVSKAAIVGHDASGVWTPLAVDPVTGAALVDTGLTIPTPQTDALTNTQLRAAPVPVSGTVTANVTFPTDQKVHDDYQGGEVLADQTGAAAVLTFTFSAAVQLVLVHAYSATSTDLARVDPFGGTPSSTLGIRALNDTPTYIPVTATTVKVYAPTGMVVSVAGFRRS